MNWDQLSSVLRNILMFVGGFIVSKGYFNADQLTTIVTSIVSLAGVGYAFWTNTTANVIASAARMTEVSQVVVTSKALADATNRPEVVSR